MLYTVAVLVVSMAPALAFLVLILALDRREPEPLALVLKVIGLGAASAIPAALVELALQGMPLFGMPGMAGAAAVAFVQVAPVEEACKLAVVLLYAWRKPAFNEENDGIVYAGASAIGFALLENVIYVARLGLGAGAARAFSAIPLHVFTAVLVGLPVGRARFAVSRAARNSLVLRGFALAWFVHGLYDMLALSGSALALLLLPFLAGLSTFGVLVLKKGRRLSLARWGGAPATAAPEAAILPPAAVEVAEAAATAAGSDAEPPVALASLRPAPTHRWMPVVSHVLLAASALFWILLVAGLWFTETGAESGSAVLGGVMLTVIPVSLGVILEGAWQKRRRRARTPL
ncbi:MAG: PrsW family glutamic-type intramembrane protease [Spirochaetes bacterium]|nr:PrsW family glutamic-type intramembrane protease [Spirochaetota bacterium]